MSYGEPEKLPGWSDEFEDIHQYMREMEDTVESLIGELENMGGVNAERSAIGEESRNTALNQLTAFRNAYFTARGEGISPSQRRRNRNLLEKTGTGFTDDFEIFASYTLGLQSYLENLE